MYYLSTRNSNCKVTAAQAIAQGISNEGGLFVPESLPKISLDDISAMVGYANSMTMNRAFKRYEGVTPGWYRQSASSHAAAQKGAGDVSP